MDAGIETRQTTAIRKRYNRTAAYYDLLDRMFAASLRKRVLALARGEVLEVGVGTGANLPYYPPGCEVTAIDFSPAMVARAAVRAARAPVPVRLLEMDAEHLDFPDDSFDTVVATCVFCSVPDPVQGLREVRRVCRPQGQIILLEHVRSENPVIGRLMDILNPISPYLVGCNINRRTMENVEKSGLRTSSVEDIFAKIVKLIVATPG